METKNSDSKTINFTKVIEPDIHILIKEKNWLVLRDIIDDWPTPDIAKIIENLDPKDKIILFLLLPKNLQSETFAELDPDLQDELLKSLTDDQVKSILTNLDPDDRTHFFSELSANTMQRLINVLPLEERKETLLLLGFPKNSVGRLMTPDYVAIKPSFTVKEALEHIRKTGIDAETINMVYVIDEKGHLIDDLPLRKLILSDENASIESIMDRKFVAIDPYADQEEAVKLMEHYDLIALPVVDKDGVLLGIVTIDDILDILREEQTEDLAKISAVHPLDISGDMITDLKRVPFRKIYKSRITWLLILLFMDVFTGGIISTFEEFIAKYTVLITFLPVLIDTAGNAGSQSATLLIRAFAVGTVKIKDWLVLLGKELSIAAILGITMGLGISIMGIIRSRSIVMLQVIVLSMVLNVILGCFIGFSLPFIFAKLKKDPASASTPLITTLADIIGTANYLFIAYLILGR